MIGSGLTVAVLGTGTMGAPTARNLLRAGFGVRVWDRSPAKAARVGVGARRASNPAQAAEGADVAITMLTDGGAVEHVMTGAAHMYGVELPLTDALLPRWHQAIAADHGDDDVAAAVTAAATAALPPGTRLTVSAT